MVLLTTGPKSASKSKFQLKFLQDHKLKLRHIDSPIPCTTYRARCTKIVFFKFIIKEIAHVIDIRKVAQIFIYVIYVCPR